MPMTDEEALAIVETLRHSTGNQAIMQLCDWITVLAQRQAVSNARRLRYNAQKQRYMVVWRARRSARKRAARALKAR
jgi:hypothetical protein